MNVPSTSERSRLEARNVRRHDHADFVVDGTGIRPSDDRYLCRRELRELIPASDMTIWRWQRDPEVAFPTPVKLGRNGRNYWSYQAVRDWIRRREAHRQAPARPTPGGEQP
jgi:predicted DNA-binding transcriptional regulator AlpA